MSTNKKKLATWQNAQQQITTILASLNRNQDLMMAAAANPVLALKELGYEIDEGLEQEFEDRIRFGPKKGPQVGALREQIFKAAGHRFDLESADAVAHVLSSLVKGHKGDYAITATQTAPLEYSPRAAKERVDPLEKARKVHPIMEPLLEYRRLQASTPRFAPKEFYDEVRQKKQSLPITKLVAHLKSDT